MKIMFIGIDGSSVVSANETLEQIEKVIKLELDLDMDKKLTWSDFYKKDNRSIFQNIYQDRIKRDTNLMADRPPFAVCTIDNEKCVRIEYYEGHDKLELIYDIRSKELHNKELPIYLVSDSYAYDYKEFLKSLGINDDVVFDVIDKIHKEE